MNYIMRILGVFCLLMMISCSQKENKEFNQERSVTDIFGREVKLPQNVDKIIGVNPGTLRMLTYISTEKIIGIEKGRNSIDGVPYIDINPELKERVSIGSHFGGDAELIIKANPDVVFGVFPNKAGADALQEKLGIPVVAISNPEMNTHIEEWYQNIELIGEVVNHADRAKKLEDFIKQNIQELAERTQNITDKKQAYVGGISMRGSHGITSTNAHYSPFVFANVENIVAKNISKKEAQAKEKKYLGQQTNVVSIDQEQLIEWNPDTIFVDSGGYEIVKKELHAQKKIGQSLNAVKQNKIYLVYALNSYSTNYEMLMADAWYIAKVMYPQNFEDIDINQKIKEILEVFYRKEIDTNQYENYFRPIKITELQ